MFFVLLRFVGYSGGLLGRGVLRLPTQEEAHTFPQDLCARQAHDGIVEHGSQGDAREEQQPGIGKRGGDPSRGGHDGSCGHAEGDDVAQEEHQAIADEAASEQEPDKGPDDIDGDGTHDHRADAEGIEHDHGDDLEQAQRDGASEIDARAALTDDEVGEQGGDGQEGAANAEYFEVGRALEPFLRERDEDKLAGDQTETEHEGEGEEGREAHQLAEGSELARGIVAQIDHHGLGDGAEHALQEIDDLRVPLVGLVVVARGTGGEIVAQQDVEHVVVDLEDDGRGQDLATEPEHASDGLGVEPQRRAPTGDAPVEDGVEEDVGVGLRGQRPVAEALPRHDGSDHRGGEHGGDIGLRALLHQQPLLHQGRLHHTRGREHKRQEGVAAEGGQPRLMIVAGDERGQEEEEEVARGCHGDVEPEDTVALAVRGLVEVDDGASQSRLLEGIGDDAEDGDHGDHAIVARREKAAQDDSEDESYELHSAIVYRAPEEAARRLFL